MKIKYSLLIGMILIAASMFVVNGQTFQSSQQAFGSDYQYYEPTYQQFYSSLGVDYTTFWPDSANMETCKSGNDIFITVVPGGCSPMVVRSDLLEEQNVPVFCKLAAIRTNPMMDIAEIRSIQFTGKYPNTVVGLVYHPSQAALRKYPQDAGKTILSDAGYAVVLLKKQVSERNMSDSVSFNTTANIRYELKNIEGVGKSMQYLPVLTNDEWQNNYLSYNFWSSRGFIRADYVDAQSARISIYSDKDTVVKSFDLRKGQLSGTIYLPGFYCRGGLSVKLDDISVPKKKVQLQINNGDEIWVNEGERFLGTECYVSKINNLLENGWSTSIRCGSEMQTLTLTKLGSELADKTANAQIEGNFTKASSTAEKLYKDYPSESDASGNYGLRALSELANLASYLGKAKTAFNLRNEIVSLYPTSPQAESARKAIKNSYDTSKASGAFTIKGAKYTIVMENAFEPSIEDANAQISVSTKDKTEEQQLRIGDTKTIANAEIKLLDITETNAKIFYNNAEQTIQLNKVLTIEGVSITLTEVNPKRVAGIEILPQYPSETSVVNVSINIGIEKRGITLSPKKTAEMIAGLNKTIERYSNIADTLEKRVDDLSKVCFATSTFLIFKNLFQNFEGKGIARQKVMPEWEDYCKKPEQTQQFGSVDNCLFAKRQEVENSVDALSTGLQNVNNQVKDANTLATANKKSFEETFIATQFAPFVSAASTSPVITENFSGKNITDMYDKGQITIEQMKDLMLYSGLSAAQFSDVSDSNSNKINEILKGITATTPVVSGGSTAADTCSNKFINPTVKFHATGLFKDLPAIVPVNPQGWYAATKPVAIGSGQAFKSYTEAGQVVSMWLCNVGPNKKEEFELSNRDDDPCILVNFQTGQPIGDIPCFDKKEGSALALNAKSLLERMQAYSGSKTVRIAAFGTEDIPVKYVASSPSTECTDFMSPMDCRILFNVCDPVLCPTSRCNLGGQYPVADVIQSGIVGSAVLCLPNFKEGIIIPVCLTGIKEGIKGYVSNLKSYRDCLQESLTTGRQIGICDEIHSFYSCDFIWRQLGPLLDVGIVKIAEWMIGQGRGGGEYMTVNTAWSSMKQSVSFIEQTYTTEIPRVFQTRSTGEFGAEVCKSFVSTNYPIIGGLADTLMKPESPVQFTAWFNEISFSEATLPPTSQYKVSYHIYAGSDAGVYYSVYLKNPPESGYYQQQQQYVVDSGYINLGQSADNAKDFTAPSGYKELCIRVNQQEECGFQRVSSSFALDYLNDKYMQSQANETNIQTEKDCISGTPSLYSLIQPNLQAGVEEIMQPEIYNRGIVRVCSSLNPGQNTNPENWKPVGYCDTNKKITCWIDKASITPEVIAGAGIRNATINQIDALSNAMVQKKGAELSAEIDGKLKNLNKLVNELALDNITTTLKPIETLADSIAEQPGAAPTQRANALYLKFRAYMKILNAVKPATWNVYTNPAGEFVVNEADLAAPFGYKLVESGLSKEEANKYLTGVTPPVSTPAVAPAAQPAPTPATTTPAATQQPAAETPEPEGCVVDTTKSAFVPILNMKIGTRSFTKYKLVLYARGKQCENSNGNIKIYETRPITGDNELTLGRTINTKFIKVGNEWQQEVSNSGLEGSDVLIKNGRKFYAEVSFYGLMAKDEPEAIFKIQGKQIGSAPKAAFRFEDGTLYDDLYYRFDVKNKWEWSLDNKNWYATLETIPYIAGGSVRANANFITSLMSKNYKEGIISLVERTKANAEGGTFASTELDLFVDGTRLFYWSYNDPILTDSDKFISEVEKYL